MIEETSIDIHLSKLVDWLIDRRHSSKDWNQRTLAIKTKIDQARKSLEDDLHLKKFAQSISFDYFMAIEILEILKETEKETKNLFGIYSSKKFQEWKTIVSNYEKNSIYLVESAQILQRNVEFEIPSLKKLILRCQVIRQDSFNRQRELEKNILEIEKQLTKLAEDFSIEGINVENELIDRIEQLPNLCQKILFEENSSSIRNLKEILKFHNDFVKHFHSDSNLKEEDFLPILNYLLEHGNKTVYQYRTSKSPIEIERTFFNYQKKQFQKEDFITDQTNIDPNPVDQIDFQIDEEIDWSAIDTVPELLDPALSSDQTNIHSISEAIQEASINGSNKKFDDGIARSNDALTILENRSTYISLINELHRIESFIKQRLNENKINETILMSFILQNGKGFLENKTENDLKRYLIIIENILQSINDRQLEKLFLMRDSGKYFDRLTNSFYQKRKLIERNRFQQKQLEEKIQQTFKEEKQIKDKLDYFIFYTKNLKEKLAQQISTKKCQNRRINIMGEINRL